MRHIPPTTRVFIGLFVITFLLTYLALNLSDYELGYFQGYTIPMSMMGQHNSPQEQPKPQVDTSDWKQYQDKAYPIAFSYPKEWTVKAAINKLKFYDVDLNPGPTSPDMHIYVSRDGFYGLDGLKQMPYKLDGKDGFIVSNNLVGIKVGDYYYTFDGSMNNKQSADFGALINTVSFQ